MCNRKTRVPAGVKNSFWHVDECAVSTAVHAGLFRMAVFALFAVLDPLVICDNIYASCKKDRYVQTEIANTTYKYVYFEVSGGTLTVHNFVTSHKQF